MDPQTVAIGIGLVVSLLFTEAFGLAAGGMIVPGYFALQFHRPMDIAVTLAVAMVTYLLVSAVSKHAIIYGRRRTVLMILTGFVVGQVTRSVFTPGSVCSIYAADAQQSMMNVIGCIVPGLIALWFDRQGTMETVGTVLTTSAVVRLCLIVLGIELAV